MCNLTLCSSNIKCQVWSSRCQTKPPVLVGHQVLLEELLCFISQNKGKVPAALLTPSLGIKKRPSQSHKFITRAFKNLLLFWTWNSLGIFNATCQINEEKRQKYQSRSKGVAIHFWAGKLVKSRRSVAPLKGTDVSLPISAWLFRIIFDIRTAHSTAVKLCATAITPAETKSSVCSERAL